jgi:hypothetical protein
MSANAWKFDSISIVELMLDTKNPRLGAERNAKTQREIIQYLFEFDKVIDLAESIAARGFFPNEPLLAIIEGGQAIVVEGNRRLAALKGLKRPSLLELPFSRKLTELAKRLGGNLPDTVPVITAPNRRATDKQISGRHIGTAVLPWQAENRANFIL